MRSAVQLGAARRAVADACRGASDRRRALSSLAAEHGRPPSGCLDLRARCRRHDALRGDRARIVGVRRSSSDFGSPNYLGRQRSDHRSRTLPSTVTNVPVATFGPTSRRRAPKRPYDARRQVGRRPADVADLGAARADRDVGHAVDGLRALVRVHVPEQQQLEAVAAQHRQQVAAQRRGELVARRRVGRVVQHRDAAARALGRGSGAGQEAALRGAGRQRRCSSRAPAAPRRRSARGTSAPRRAAPARPGSCGRRTRTARGCRAPARSAARRSSGRRGRKKFGSSSRSRDSG